MSKKSTVLYFIIFFCITVSASGQSLEQNFKTPPDNYKPLGWWHWVSGEITKDGITKDLEGMKMAGMRGATIFDLGDHIYDEGKNILFSTTWNEYVSHALKEAERLNLEIGFHYSPGWSGSGGPWVPVENSMKKIVYNTVELDGGKHITLNLEKPKHIKDFYRDISFYAIRGNELKFLSEKETSGSGRGVQWVNLIDQYSPDLSTVNYDDIIDITSKVEEDQLVWDAPPGQWTILRMGYTSTGKGNRASRPVFGYGLEADKYNASMVEKAYYDGIIGHAIELEKKSGTQSFQTITMDSWEVGYQNWSDKLPEEFKKRRGYAMDKFLPVLAGCVIESSEVSRRFLWDCRLTFGELIYEKYASTIRKNSHKYGKKIIIEPYREGGFNSFDYGMQADIVMSEFWKGGHNFNRIKSVASIAHVRGTKEHRAESFTTNYFNGIPRLGTSTFP